MKGRCSLLNLVTVLRVSSNIHCPYQDDTNTEYMTEALQGLRLIPRTPSPSPVPTPVPLEERPFDSLTPDEVQELARRFHVRLSLGKVIFSFANKITFRRSARPSERPISSQRISNQSVASRKNVIMNTKT